ncbi:hypothetical protein BU24DRAFT_416771 [Aaosphaeria arxii CBS 175.79]|uniref:Uncharacterized protein n=1 Tax=Aaosphaeria arxii CBS 175.79 TaxID=1450172 RepID=A0A6A5Y7A6_9PLEO|nr:uncharacterized protein BU24DRAFT_416771 [Aaosphaeria arxii CBS 175.79]KAF2021103.1 hypothetical protein BU24DRAFT_416771 [Aaosphaeria arxii CBS 175.79]
MPVPVDNPKSCETKRTSRIESEEQAGKNKRQDRAKSKKGKSEQPSITSTSNLPPCDLCIDEWWRRVKEFNVAKKYKNDVIHCPSDHATSTEAYKGWREWLNHITPARESILRHGQDVAGLADVHHRFDGQEPFVIRDIFRAREDIEWFEISTILRDLFSPSRLFVGFEQLESPWLGTFDMQVRAVSPIALITIALNNWAVLNEEPYEFSWSPAPQFGGTATLYVALTVRSNIAAAKWRNSTPAQRLKMCSVWETTIPERAMVVGMPFALSKLRFSERRQIQWSSLSLSNKYSGLACLLATSIGSDGEDVLCLAESEGQTAASPFLHRKRASLTVADTSAALFRALVAFFSRQSDDLKEWESLSQERLMQSCYTLSPRQPSKQIR